MARLCLLTKFETECLSSRLFVVLATLLVVLGTTPCLRAQQDARPNVVVIMTDDMGYSDLGCFGGEIMTPNIDQLAADGLRFTNFYSENMCWVSRVAMLTGVNHRAAMRQSAIHPKTVTLAERLGSSGYATRIAGKWHLAGKRDSVSPLDRGFQHWYGIPGGAASFFAPNQLTRDRKRIESEFANPDYYFTHAISDNAVHYIDSAPRDQPLFLYVAYTAAHWPLHALPDDIAAYSGKYRMGWDKLREQRLLRMKEMGIIANDVSLSPRHANVPAWQDEPHQAWQQRRMEVYAAQVTAMDRGVGQIVDALKDSGRFDNTLLLYTTDNGGCHVEYGRERKGDYLPTATRSGKPMIPGNLPEIMPGPENTYQSYGYGWANASNTPYRMFKQHDHEGGIRTPMIAHWPAGILAKGEIVTQVSHLIDIMPTVLDATEIEHQPLHEAMHFDGMSLLSALTGSPTNSPRVLYFSHNKGKALRDGDWKIVTMKKKNGWELYDLKSDPNELDDLARSKPAKLQQMKSKWTRWEKQQVARNSIE